MHTQRSEYDVMITCYVCIVRPDPIYSIYSSSSTRVANVILTSPDCLAASITLITA